VTQFALPLDWHSARNQRCIIPCAANRDAIAFLDKPDQWPSHCVILTGARKSGRSTLAATIAMTRGVTVIDDADREDEAALFHAWNRTREAGGQLLLVAGQQPPGWEIGLPDLRSRLATAAIVRIGEPDEDLAQLLIEQGLAQAGTAYAPDLAPYLAARLPRCYDAIDAAIASLNAESLSSSGKISLLRAKLILAGTSLLAED